MEKKNEELCFLCKSQANESANILNVQVKVNKNEMISFLDAMQQLTGIDFENENEPSKILCLDCQQRIKYAYQIRQQIMDAFEVPIADGGIAVEVYEIIADGADIKCIKADPNADEYSDNEGMVEYTEVDENFELNFEGSDDDADSEKTPPKEDPLDAVSFLLEKKSLFNEEKSEKNSSHKRQRTHVCEVCEKSFMRKSNLVDHLRLHANVRLFKCEYCEKEFVQAGNYRSHLRIHTKERPYACSMCPKTYNQSSALKVHIRSHTNEKNYVCNICSKAFTNSSDLNKHKRVHDPSSKFKCEQCDKTFAQRVNLKNHTNRHHPSDKAKSKKTKADE